MRGTTVTGFVEDIDGYQLKLIEPILGHRACYAKNLAVEQEQSYEKPSILFM